MNINQQRAALLPCPFCGAGETVVQENGRPWLGKKYGEPTSVSVRHWCDHADGQPSRVIERVGRDRTSAINAWNRRAAPQSQATQQACLSSPEVQALRKDAERYRWLRNPCSGAERVIFYSRGDYGKGFMSGGMLDAAIDAAMEKSHD